jgi:hypothetical protein
MRRASVCIARVCKSEFDSGSDYRRSYFAMDNYDQEILGVFFSNSQANQCAKKYVKKDLSHNFPDDDDDEVNDMEGTTMIWTGICSNLIPPNLENTTKTTHPTRCG